jgi:tetratricopeptide (TPR) repeat protein
VTAALLMMLLMMPRAAPPEDIPLPRIDAKALEAVRQDDIARAAAARATRLPSEVLLVGTSLRELNLATTRDASEEDLGSARTALDQAVRVMLVDGDKAFDGLRSLRAVQLEGFLAEVAKFEASGKMSDELDALAGGFVDRMHAAGWLEGSKVALDERELRAAYKLVWSAQVGVERMPQLALTLDEQRALYTLYLTRPHAPEAQRASYEAQRKAATTSDDCLRAVAQERLAIDQWRLEKVRRLGEIDPTYPTAYALGVAYYQVGRYDSSLEAFRSWVERHPEGPLSLRARNHMKAAIAAYGPS